jgi:nitroreductase
MDLFEAIEKRRSIRKHKQEPVLKEDLRKILEAARLAPSGDNRQRARYETFWIGAFNEQDVKKIVKVPESLAVIALLPVGVADEDPLAKPRKAFEEIFFKDRHGTRLEL